MTLQDLSAIGLTKEQAERVLAMAPSNMMTKDEAKTAIEKAREEEKAKVFDKLNSAVEAQRSVEASLQNANKEKEALEAKVTKAEDSFNTLKASLGKDNKVDIAALINEATDKVTKKYEAMFTEERTKTSTELANLSKQNTKLSIERYRDKRVAEEGGETALILALVSGETKEEVDSSIDLSKTEFKKLQARFGGNSNGSTDGKVTVPPPVNSNATVPPPGGSTTLSVKTMDTKAYANRRSELMADLNKRFAR